MSEEILYTTQQVEEIAQRAAQYALEQVLKPPNIEKEIGLFPEGDDTMNKRVRDKVQINGETHWIGGYCNQDLYDAYTKLLTQKGLITWNDDYKPKPLFGDYIKEYYAIYKQGQESNTVINRNRNIKNHILPQFGDIRIDQITTSDIQKWLNMLAGKYSNETLLKLKNTMSPVFDAAVEDNLIQRNPFSSQHLVIAGKETIHHKAIPRDKMKEIRDNLTSLDLREMIVCALLSYTGMRLEEVLGLMWSDIDDNTIHIIRAVVHPGRNLPEVKDPKTKTSKRIIPYPEELKKILEPHRSNGYLVYSKNGEVGERPLSFTEVRRVIDKIKKRFDLNGYSAHDFRDTCATEWRENGMPLDVIARILGHSKTETTEKRYVKYREDILETAKSLM